MVGFWIGLVVVGGRETPYGPSAVCLGRCPGRVAYCPSPEYARAMVVFGKWSLWATIVFTTVVIAVSIAIAGNYVIAAALVAVVVVVGAIIDRSDKTKI